MKVDGNIKIEQYFEDIEENMIGYQVEVPLRLYYPNKDEEVYIKVKSSINLKNEYENWKIKSIKYIFSSKHKQIFIYD
ncbi:hypothetical protein VQL36_03095 [Chengkuizengella sp. SCS-71B]|uniref:hypothetical protein n=1 Tax=Chengkuizengella sp. SCS-71B TaxID=3115290 RepID=UPI0032C20E71